MAKEAKTHQKKMTVRVDFTPMVDMNMLLITFFMLCTTMIKSQTLQISLPSNEKVDKTEQNKVKQSEAITIVLDNDVNKDGVPTKGYVYYYEGLPQVTDANHDGVIDQNNMKEVAFLPNENGAPKGIRAIIQERNEEVVKKVNELKLKWKNKELTDEQYQELAKQARNDSTVKRPTIIIKATPHASFLSLVSALDEMQINSIARYQIDRINQTDSALMMDIKAKHLKNK